jgi:hypothetical protein
MYQLGLNTVFNSSSRFKLSGSYFTSIAHIFNYINYGNKLCIISILDGTRVVKVGNCFKAKQFYINKIIKGRLEIVQYLVEHGVDISMDNYYILRWTAGYGYFKTVKYLLEIGVSENKEAANAKEDAFVWSAENGHYDVVRLFIEHNIDICAKSNQALKLSAENGHYDIVVLLVENGACVRADRYEALRMSARYGHLDGADIHADDDYALKWCVINEHLPYCGEFENRSKLRKPNLKYCNIIKYINSLD